MYVKKVITSLLCIVVATQLSSCVDSVAKAAPSAAAPSSTAVVNTSVSSQHEWDASYTDLVSGGGKKFILNPTLSSVRIYAFRAGKAARFGHNHVLAAPAFVGYFYLPPTDVASARFDLEFRFDQLEIDNPQYRALLGTAFATILSPDAIEGTRQHMLGETNLQADQYPYVRIHSLQISGEAPKFSAKIQVQMHGQSREMWVPLNVDGLPEQLKVSGSLVLRQSDFGVTPYSVLGGMLAVQDEVVIEFQLQGN